MPCYKPLQGWYSRFKNPSGKRSVVFRKEDAFVDLEVEVPCGRCIGCRLERSRQWAVRLVHESSLHPFSYFLTLTYDDQHVPVDGSLNKRHFQLFMKRLRKARPDVKIRYFHCGEYGDLNERPHYHCILFGVDFPDKLVLMEEAGKRLYISTELTRLWGLGNVNFGAVTFESAAYVARYSLKKISVSDFKRNNATDEEKAELLRRHYERINPYTGEIVNRLPEYVTMSLKPGIGQGWLDKFADDVFPRDSVIVRGKERKPPKYYLSKVDPGDFNHELFRYLSDDDQLGYLFPYLVAKSIVTSVRGDRVKFAKSLPSVEFSPARLREKEQCKIAQTKSLKRNI